MKTKIYNEQEEITDSRTYEDYVDLGKVNTRRYLMISELIDNSISSFDREYGEGNWKKKLKVDISIRNLNKQIKKFNGIEYFDNSYIVVEDNAFGITYDDLADSLRLNKKNESNSSKMNVHGRGLKQSAFYFGLGVDLISKVKGSKQSFRVENKPIEKGLDTEVKYIRYNANQEKTGTTIIISNLRKNHRFTKKRLEEVFDALKYRYSKLILDKKLVINFKYKIDDMDEYGEETISGALNDKALLSEDFDYEKKDRNRIANSSKKIVQELINKADEKRNIFKYPELALETSNKLSNILKGSLDEPFSWKQTIKINEKEKVTMEFWLISRKQKSSEEASPILKRGYSIKRGIRINEGDRAILHPPIIEGQVSTYLDPLPSTNRSGSVDNRFAGEVNISDFSAQTTTDKSTFEFKSQEDKERFDDQVSVVFDIFEQYVLQGRSSNKNGVAHKFTEDDENKLESTITAKFKEQVVTIKFEDNRTKIVADIIFNKQTFLLNAKISDKSSPQQLLNVKINEQDKVIDANWFINHNIWKNINEHKNFNVEALIPIFLLLVFQELEFNKKAKRLKKKLTENDVKELSPSKNINEPSKKVE